MKKFLLRTVAVSILCIFFTSLSFGQEYQLERLVSEAKSALLIVEKESIAQNLPRLDSVTLEINVTQSAKVGGKVSFFIVSFGSETNTDVTNSVKLVLTPPPPDSGSDVSSVGLAQPLADSILAGAQAIQVAGQGLPPLYPKELTTTINFVLVSDGSGGIELDFPPFSAELGGGINSKYVQKITIAYKL